MLPLVLIAAVALSPAPTPSTLPLYLGPVQAGDHLYPLLMQDGHTVIDTRYYLVPVVTPSTPPHK